MNSTLSEGLDRAAQQVILQTKALMESFLPAGEAATHVLMSFRDALNVQAGDNIFVTVGHPKGEQPYYHRVIMHQDRPTKIQTAKMFRKDVAKELCYRNPSELYYVIWLFKNDQWVFFWASDNAPVKFMEG